MSSTRATEMTLPDNHRSRLATALWSALQFAGGMTDFIIHVGRPVFVKSARGVIPLSELGLPGADFPVVSADIKNFMASFVDGVGATDSANTHWDYTIAPVLARMEPINRSIPVPPTAIGGKTANLRISLIRHGQGKLAMVVRVVLAPPPLESLRLPAALLQRIQTNPRGLLIITGPTASSKTATALSIFSWLNDHTSGHLMTIEDPIEVPMQPNKCVITQRQVGQDVASFGAGLHEALRHAPEAILAGEVRDRDAAEAAVMGGESGALMVVTTHGRSIVGTLRKILALCGDNVSTAMRTVMAGSLIGVIRQELVPHQDGSAYSMVCDALHVTDAVSAALSKGDWSMIEALCSRDSPTDGFYPMTARLAELVTARQVTVAAADRVRRSSR